MSEPLYQKCPACRGTRVVVAELKVGDNEPTAAQRQWLAGFAGASVPAYTWWPENWAEIQTVLRSR